MGRGEIVALEAIQGGGGGWGAGGGGGGGGGGGPGGRKIVPSPAMWGEGTITTRLDQESTETPGFRFGFCKRHLSQLSDDLRPPAQCHLLLFAQFRKAGNSFPNCNIRSSSQRQCQLIYLRST